MKINEIRELACVFRLAVDNACNHNVFKEYPFNRFPNECCDDICDIFGQILLENDVSVCKVHGIFRYDNWEHKYPHVWLQLEDETIIDLTGDQYSDNPIMLNYNIPCFIGKPTELHKLFVNDDLQIYPFYGIDNYYDEKTRRRLWSIYDTIRNYMTNH